MSDPNEAPLNSLEEQNHKLQKSLDYFQEKNERQKRTIKAMKDSARSDARKIEFLESQLQQARVTMNRLEEENAFDQKQYPLYPNDFIKQIDTAFQDNDSYTARLIRSMVDQLDRQQKSLHSMTTEIKGLQEQILQLESIIVSKDKDIQSLKNDLEQLKEDYAARHRD